MFIFPHKRIRLCSPETKTHDETSFPTKTDVYSFSFTPLFALFVQGNCRTLHCLVARKQTKVTRIVVINGGHGKAQFSRKQQQKGRQNTS